MKDSPLANLERGDLGELAVQELELLVHLRAAPGP
jgi:hypothetical protein